MAKIFLGVVADDFTGASDAASFLADAGVPVVLFNGVPEKKPSLKEDTAALVVALKTRTMPRAQAVRESLEAFAWLKEMGAKKLYLKYCSTFDSTPEGNIGPVVDAVLNAYQLPGNVLCPSLPVNGRVVKAGKLYVNGVLLEESSMKDHPLTPMRKSSVPELMEEQAAYRARAVSMEELEKGGTEKDWFSGAEAARYLVPDYYEEEHGDKIAQAFGGLPFLTGGSGLVGALGRQYMLGKQEGMAEKSEETGTRGRAVLLAGSCSAMTLRQIADFQWRNLPSYCLQPDELMNGRQSAETVFPWVLQQEAPALVYSSASPEDLKKSQSLGKERVAAQIEKTLSDLARMARDEGYTRIITAGGETSGAVTKALGYQAFYIGKSVAPGVPVMTPVENPQLRLVLKSGNFGQPDFFVRALRMTGNEKQEENTCSMNW